MTAELAKKVTGLVCLATPVFLVRERPLEERIWLTLMLGPVVALAAGAAWVGRALGARAQLIAALMVTAALLGGFGLYRLYQWSRKFITRSDYPFLGEKAALFVRSAADEASGVLDGAYIIGWGASKLFTSLIGAVHSGYDQILEWQEMARRYWPVTASIILVLIGGFFW
jgi:hypothetical protein